MLSPSLINIITYHIIVTVLKSFRIKVILHATCYFYNENDHKLLCTVHYLHNINIKTFQTNVRVVRQISFKHITNTQSFYRMQSHSPLLCHLFLIFIFVRKLYLII